MNRTLNDKELIHRIMRLGPIISQCNDDVYEVDEKDNELTQLIKAVNYLENIVERECSECYSKLIHTNARRCYVCKKAWLCEEVWNGECGYLCPDDCHGVMCHACYLQGCPNHIERRIPCARMRCFFEGSATVKCVSCPALLCGICGDRCEECQDREDELTDAQIDSP